MTSVLEGIDVSHNNGYLNWQALADNGASFAYIKASEGASYTDPYFVSNFTRAQAVGIVAGAYHYWRPDVDAIGQIDHFQSLYTRYRAGELPPALDVECDPGQYPGYSANQFINHVSVCLARMKQLFGVTPLIYTYPDFWRTRMGNTHFFSNYPLWVAGYPNVPNPMIGGWTDYKIHQYNGIGLDRDRFNGTDADLREFAGVSSSYTPPGARFALIGGFKDFYLSEPKAIEYFGLPIGPERVAAIGTWTGTVQDFERARFEWHTESGVGKVLLGLVNEELLTATGRH